MWVPALSPPTLEEVHTLNRKEQGKTYAQFNSIKKTVQTANHGPEPVPVRHQLGASI